MRRLRISRRNWTITSPEDLSLKSVDTDFPDDVTPQQAAAWSRETRRLQGLYDDALDRANSAHRAQTGLLQKQAQLQTQLDSVNSQIPGAQTSSDSAKNLLVELAGRLEELRTARDAATARLLGMMPVKHPLVLFPARLETRFVSRQTDGGGVDFMIRIYPDDVHIDAHETGLTEAEEVWGRQFWQNTTAAGDNGETKKLAWRQLSDRFGVRRAAWIARVLENQPTTVERRDGNWTRAPEASVLPNRWVAIAYRDQRPVFTAWGNPVPDRLAAGLAPLSNTAIVDDQLPQVDEGMRWMLDFEAAVAAGMGMRVSLATDLVQDGFDRLLVVGIKADLDDQASAARLTGLLDAQRYTHELAFVPQNTPTNNTAEAPSGYSSADLDADTAFDIERGPALFQPGDGSDGDVLASALGVASDVFAHVQNASGAEQRLARAMNTALWPILDSALLRQLSAEVPSSSLRGHWVEHVRSRGPFASLRVGNQPYGMLAVTSLKRWRLAGQTAEDAKLASLLQMLRKLWSWYGRSAPRVELGADTLTLLRQEANSCRYLMSQTAALSSAAQEPLLLRRLPAAFDDAVLHSPPNPNYLRLLRASDAQTIRNESFPDWDAKNAPKPHSLLYLFLREAALRLLDSQAPEQPAFQESLASMENLTVEALHYLMAETLDAGTYRLDAWITSLATKQLKALRQNAPLGVHVGGYGWLENVRPAAPLRQVEPPAEVGSAPLFVSDSNKGYVLAPSLGHAATAAVLRSGYLSHQGQTQGEPLAIDLSSERVHRAKWMLDGVRQGQSLGALLGYRFERGLHDAGLDRFIMPFRVLAGLKQQDELAQAYEHLRQAEALFKEVRDLYAQSQEASARADAARLLQQQAESQRNLLQDEVNAINALQQLAAAADAEVGQLDSRIAQLQAAKPRSGVQQKPGKPNFEVEIVDESDLDAWVEQLVELQGQRADAFSEAKLAHNNFNDRVGTRDFDLAKINAHNDPNNPDSIPAIQAVVAKEEAAAQALDQQAVAKEGTRGKTETDLSAARAALGQLLNQQWAKVSESVTANNVVDGLELQRRWKAGSRRQPPQEPWDATTVPFGNDALGFPTLETADFKALDIQLRALDEMVDAVSDVVVAESVYHLVQGNPLRAGATLDAIATGEMAPPELEVVRTPRTGIGLTHRLLVAWSSSVDASGASSQWAVDDNQVRAQAEPHLNAWAAKLLGNPSQIRCRVEFLNPETKAVVGTTELALADLRLSPLDVIFMAEGDGKAQRSELEQRLVFQLLRSEAAAALGEVQVRLIFDRDTSSPAEVMSFGELVEMARTARKLIAGARAIDGRDLSLPEDPAALGVDADELAARVDHAVQALGQAQTDLLSLLNTQPSAPAAVEPLRTALLRMTYFGIQGAVPLSATGTGDDGLKVLLAQAQSVSKEAAQHLDRIAKLVGANETTAEKKRDYQLARGREVFGPDFRILPRLVAASGSVLNQAFGDSLALQDNDPFAVITLFERMTRIRDGVARLNAALLYAETLDETSGPALQVGQLPYQPNDRWVALPRIPNQSIKGGKLSLVAHVPFQSSIDFTQPVSGLLIDEWVEVVPSQTETAGLTFHYDQPSACAPQAVLIAVPSDDNRTVWDLDMLTSVLHETLEMAQLRAQSINDLVEASWVEDDMPNGARPLGDGESWNWVNANPAPLFGKLAHQSVAAAGMHQHFFDGAAEAFVAGPGEILFAYVLLDPSQLPSQVMLQWNDGSWDHRAYWGVNDIGWGVDGTSSLRFMGPLPTAGQWVRLEVPVELVGLEGRQITGMAFTLFDGRATWDRAGKGYRPALILDADAIDLSRAAETSAPGG
jgi:hypothetical protein